MPTAMKEVLADERPDVDTRFMEATGVGALELDTVAGAGQAGKHRGPEKIRIAVKGQTS